MSKQVAIRRGTATEHASFTGIEGEITVDTTNTSLRVHNGATVGGRQMARADGVNASGDWPINITGNAATATTATSATTAGTLSGTVAIANGGTGSTTASAARTALGAAASGNNTDITALDQDVSVTATGTIASGTIGYRGLPQSTNTTLALADAGKHIYTASNIIIPANGSIPFPTGTAIVIVNSGSATKTISITSDTLRQAGTANTGTRTLAAYGMATLIKVASTTWMVSGTVS